MRPALMSDAQITVVEEFLLEKEKPARAGRRQDEEQGRLAGAGRGDHPRRRHGRVLGLRRHRHARGAHLRDRAALLDSGTPRGLTLVFAAAPGDGKERGLNRLAREGW
jgi:hypothetical protein